MRLVISCSMSASVFFCQAKRASAAGLAMLAQYSSGRAPAMDPVSRLAVERGLVWDTALLRSSGIVLGSSTVSIAATGSGAGLIFGPAVLTDGTTGALAGAGPVDTVGSQPCWASAAIVPATASVPTAAGSSKAHAMTELVGQRDLPVSVIAPPDLPGVHRPI